MFEIVDMRKYKNNGFYWGMGDHIGRAGLLKERFVTNVLAVLKY